MSTLTKLFPELSKYAALDYEKAMVQAAQDFGSLEKMYVTACERLSVLERVPIPAPVVSPAPGDVVVLPSRHVGRNRIPAVCGFTDESCQILALTQNGFMPVEGAGVVAHYKLIAKPDVSINSPLNGFILQPYAWPTHTCFHLLAAIQDVHGRSSALQIDCQA